MADAIDSWLTSLLFISAPALMIFSTAAGYAQLHRGVAAAVELLPALRRRIARSSSSKKGGFGEAIWRLHPLTPAIVPSRRRALSEYKGA